MSPVDRQALRRVHSRPLLPLWGAILTAVVGGCALDAAFPDVGWWPLAFVGVGFSLISLIGRSVGGSFLVGFVFAAVFYGVHVVWTARYLGPVPWLALSGFESLLMALGAIPITLAYRWLPRVLPGRWAQVTVLPLLIGGLWSLRELIVGTVPYGGFPWGRVGMSQSESPLATTASWVGVTGLTFLMVLLCATVIEVVRSGGGVRAMLPAASVAVLLVFLPAFPTTPHGTIRVGAVQGAGPSGYFDVRTRGAILQAQTAATLPILDEGVDVVLWPEGSVDSDPLANPATAATLDVLAERAGAPLLVNAATLRGDQIFNTSMLWVAGEGATQIHDKAHPVPFGEYVPDRAFFRLLAPDLIDLIKREYTPGTNPPWMDVAGTRIGLAICFDVIYDDVVWSSIEAGAEVLMFQTNNADFRGTDESLQQLAVARMRAIETGRAVVNLSTVGTSQVISPDGAVIDAVEAGAAGAMVVDVPRRTGLTPASVIGPWLQLVLAVGSLAALVVLGVCARIRRNDEPPTP